MPILAQPLPLPCRVFLLEMSLSKLQLILSLLFHEAQLHQHPCSTSFDFTMIAVSLSRALVAESRVCLVQFLRFNCRLRQKQPHTALPVSTFPVFDQTWHIMQTEDDLDQFADMTRNLFSFWISFLLAQQAAWLACVPWEAAPLLIFFSSGETKEKPVNSGR